MRKVLFKKWITAEYEENPVAINGKKIISGTNCFGEMTSAGYFHQWGNAYEEFETGAGNYSIALIESKDGKIHEVLPCNFIFI